MRIHPTENQKPGTMGELELFVARSGLLSARINRNGSLLHLHSAIAPEKEADYCPGIEFWGDLIVFLGIGLGYHIAPYLSSLSPGKRLLLVDYFPRCIEYCVKNRFQGLQSNLASVSSITPGWERIVQEQSIDAQYIQVIKHPASWHAHRDFYDRIMEKIRFKRRVKTESAPAMLFYNGFFLEEELLGALTRKNQATAVFPYNNNENAVGFESRFSRAVQERRPRYILSVNMKGFDANGSVGEISKRLGVPVVVWFVDDPHPILLSQKSAITNHLFAFSWERTYIPWLSGPGFGAAHYLPLAGDPALFPSPVKPGHTTELGFVGSSMGRTFQGEIASRFLWNENMTPLVHHAVRQLLTDRRKPLPAIINEACRALNFVLPFKDGRNLTWLSSYIIHSASMLLRKEMAEACLPLGLEMFGDPDGWRELLGSGVLAHADIDYRTGLSAVYRSIAINLNVTSCQMPTAVNQRVFDVPLSGGFVLSDSQSDLGELFASDEIAVYTSRRDLIDKISYFRVHPDEREHLAAKARAAVLARHTYDHRIAEIEKILL